MTATDTPQEWRVVEVTLGDYPPRDTIEDGVSVALYPTWGETSAPHVEAALTAAGIAYGAARTVHVGRGEWRNPGMGGEVVAYSNERGIIRLPGTTRTFAPFAPPPVWLR